jgi:hypothetical protein
MTGQLVKMITSRTIEVTESVTDHVYFSDVERPGVNITIRFFEFPSSLGDEVT